MVLVMKEWDVLFSNLDSIDFSYRKNLNRLKRGPLLSKTTKDDLILDLFCGRCDTSYGLRDYGYKIISGDISLKLLIMNKDVKNKIQLNSLLLPFKNNQFKGIIIQGGLHHLDDFDQIVICLREAKRVLKSNGYLFISEPGNTLCLKIWLFLIKKTKLWKISSYSKNWHDLYKAEEKTHSLYLSNTSKLIHYLKNNWTIEFHKVGLVTEFFTLKKDD
ncbi:MAG: methyltransferase domain-containing protein [Deltaproteobacteria bacterium]|nr:methyltransferase domain-containing protein [Deltaproteobacteria bacterium]